MAIEYFEAETRLLRRYVTRVFHHGCILEQHDRIGIVHGVFKGDTLGL